MLRGPDLSSYKSDVNLAAIDCDFMIDKSTGGTGYVNRNCDAQVQRAIALNKKWGVYHYYADGWSGNDPIAEADWFVDNCHGYIGKGILVLDWERGGNPHVNDTNKALAWLQHVESRTGVKPIIYMSLSLVTSLNWSAVIAGGFGLWVADYVDNNTVIPNYQMDPKRDPNPHWDGKVNNVMWQFTSTGRLNGYGGNLDCNFFYGTRAAWDAYAGTHTAPVPKPTTTTTTIHHEPLPPPITTTTTTQPELPPQPDPVTTTTTTEEPQPDPSTTTTTTAPEPPQLPIGTSFWIELRALLVRLLNKLEGKNNG